MLVPVYDRPSVAEPTETQDRAVMESRSATIHRKMPIPARQLPITESAHKAGNGRRPLPAATGIARSARRSRRAQWLADREAELLPHPIFPCCLHAAGGDRGHRLPEQACRLRHPVPRRGRDALAPSPPTRPIWAPRSALPPCCIPGARPYSIIRTCTVLSPAAGSRWTANDGSPAGPASSYQSGCCLACSAGCFCTTCTRRFTAGRLSFFSATLLPAEGKARVLRSIWLACGSIGMPSRWGCRHPHPSQTRTCRFPASGSSRESFARCGVSVEDPDWRQWVPGQQFVEVGP